MDEYAINWLKNQDYVEVTFPGGTKEKNLLVKMAIDRVPGVKITAQNIDGSIVGHVPRNCILFRRPPKGGQTEAQREASLRSIAAAWAAQAAKTDETEEDEDLYEEE